MGRWNAKATHLKHTGCGHDSSFAHIPPQPTLGERLDNLRYDALSNLPGAEDEHAVINEGPGPNLPRELPAPLCVNPSKNLLNEYGEHLGSVTAALKHSFGWFQPCSEALKTQQ